MFIAAGCVIFLNVGVILGGLFNSYFYLFIFFNSFLYFGDVCYKTIIYWAGI